MTNELDAAATRAPAASKVDSRPQAILKFRPPGSLDYKARHGPQATLLLMQDIICPKKQNSFHNLSDFS